MRILAIALSVLILASCNEQRKGSFVFLNKSAVFNADSVRSFLNIVPDAQLDSSKRVFLSAVDLLKNQKSGCLNRLVPSVPEHLSQFFFLL